MTPTPLRQVATVVPTPFSDYPGALESVGMGRVALQTFLALAVVCILAVVVLRFVLPLVGKNRIGGGGYIQVLQRFSLEGRRSLLLVRVLDKVLLIGSSDGGINLLTEFDEVEDGVMSAPGMGPGNVPFEHIFKRLRDSRRKRAAGTQRNDDESTASKS